MISIRKDNRTEPVLFIFYDNRKLLLAGEGSDGDS